MTVEDRTGCFLPPWARCLGETVRQARFLSRFVFFMTSLSQSAQTFEGFFCLGYCLSDSILARPRLSYVVRRSEYAFRDTWVLWEAMVNRARLFIAQNLNLSRVRRKYQHSGFQALVRPRIDRDLGYSTLKMSSILHQKDVSGRNGPLPHLKLPSSLSDTQPIIIVE
jgi:hypothetical protein